MTIQWKDDLGAPLAVTAIDIIVESTTPQWDEYAAYGVPIVTWLAAGFNKGGTFVKNMAIASTPLAVNRIYRQVRGGVSSKVGRRISRWPAPIVEQPFGGARLV